MDRKLVMTRAISFFDYAKISQKKIREIIRYFAVDLQATQIAKLSRLNRNTVNRYVTLLRELIAKSCELESPFQGEVEVDESFFGARRVCGKRGRGALGKTIVFSVYKRHGKVYTEIVKDCSRATLYGIIHGKVNFKSTIHSDKWRAYDGLVDLGYRKHYQVNHGANIFATEKMYINWIENFWGLAKVRLSKFRGMQKSTFYLHLKECEFRFNHRHDDLYKLILKLIKSNPVC